VAQEIQSFCPKEKQQLSFTTELKHHHLIEYKMQSCQQASRCKQSTTTSTSDSSPPCRASRCSSDPQLLNSSSKKKSAPVSVWPTRPCRRAPPADHGHWRQLRYKRMRPCHGHGAERQRAGSRAAAGGGAECQPDGRGAEG
jgi:hypothetical protein